MLEVTRNWVKRYGDQGPIFFSLLLHSKGLTQSMVDALRAYHGSIKQEFDGNVVFPTFHDVAATLVTPPGDQALLRRDRVEVE